MWLILIYSTFCICIIKNKTLYAFFIIKHETLNKMILKYQIYLFITKYSLFDFDFLENNGIIKIYLTVYFKQ